MKVLIDTNMFLVPGKYKVDIFYQLKSLGYTEFFTLSRVIDELKKLSEKKGKDSSAAKLGLILVEKYSVKVLESSGHVDKSLLSFSDYAVCTQDRKLIKSLVSNSRKVIFLRQKKYLVE